MKKYFVLLLMALLWLPFILSAQQYSDEWWFVYLLGSRIALFIIPVLTIVWMLLNKPPTLPRNFVSGYFVIGMLVQASHGILEGETSFAFYSFVGMHFLFSSFAYEGNFKQWIQTFFPFVITAIITPFFFKGFSQFSSVGEFVDQQSMTVAWIFLSGIALTISVEKFSLKEKLIEEKDRKIKIREKKIEDLKKEITETATNTAIAKTTQALCHDIRKPLSMVELILDSLQEIKESDDSRDFAATALPEVKRAMATADDLINDVMSIGANDKALKKETIPATKLIKDCLETVFRVYPDTELPISYETQPNLGVVVDQSKVARVFSNIIGNAVQASEGRLGAALYFKTRKADDMVEFTLGNGGSRIPEESLPKLFDAFFTSNKKGGTGLGLAIAKKWVSAHGGGIGCASGTSEQHQNGYVEFIFTLPLSEKDATDATLPTSSREILDAIKAIGMHNLSASKVKSMLTSKVLGPKSISVLVVDDEKTYRTGILSKIKSIAPANLKIQFTEISEIDTFPLSENFDLLIVDIDLSDTELNGFDVISFYRKRDPKAVIAVHSNRLDPSYLEQAFKSGANHKIPKPATLETLAQLILEATKGKRGEPAQEETVSALQVEQPERKPKVLYADDDQIYLKAWASKIGRDTDFVTYLNPDDMLRDLDKGKVDPSEVELLITDFYFDNKASVNGKELAQKLRRLYPKMKLALCTNDTQYDNKGGLFDMMLPKVPNESWCDISAKLS